MNTRLMFREKDFDPDVRALFGEDFVSRNFQVRQIFDHWLQSDSRDPAQLPCAGHQLLQEDLELERILDRMAGDDIIMRISCASALYAPLTDAETIRSRQAAAADALNFREEVRALYAVTLEAEKKSSSWQWLDSTYLTSTWSSAIGLLKVYTEELAALRKIADRSIERFTSEAFRRLFELFRSEFSDEYLNEVRETLSSLSPKNGYLISAEFGNRLQGVNYVLRVKEKKRFRWNWQFAPLYSLAAKDDKGSEDLDRRIGRAINEPANALAQSAEHLRAFFARLRLELGFYVGCIRLAEELESCGMPVCFPEILPMESRDRFWDGLYDVSLALLKKSAVQGNTLCAEDTDLYLITGANQGGKSTFLRSIGQAQLMAQCGMFTGARSLGLPLRRGVFTHFKKEEDSEMQSGKLDEELTRMDAMIADLRPDCTALFNESFAATNEREGSEICRQVTQALLESRVEVFSVTHLYTYASAFASAPRTRCLRAQRLDDGTRTFRIEPGEPLPTAFGEDLYRKIFELN